MTKRPRHTEDILPEKCPNCDTESPWLAREKYLPITISESDVLVLCPLHVCSICDMPLMTTSDANKMLQRVKEKKSAKCQNQ